MQFCSISTVNIYGVGISSTIFKENIASLLSPFFFFLADIAKGEFDKTVLRGFSSDKFQNCLSEVLIKSICQPYQRCFQRR